MAVIPWKHLYRLVLRKASLGRVLTEIQLERLASRVACQLTNSDRDRTVLHVLFAGGTRRGVGSENAFVEQIRKDYTDMRVTVVNISDASAPDVVADLTVPWPFKTSSFDIVISTWVIEHLSDPKMFSLEAYRVLAEGGILVVTVPFIHRIHGSPFDYWRFTDTALVHLARTAGFGRVEVIRTGGTPFLCVIALLWLFFRIPVIGAFMAFVAGLVDYTLLAIARMLNKGTELVESYPISYILYACKEEA